MDWTSTSLTKQHHGRTAAEFHSDASMVTVEPFSVSKSRRSGIAVISLDLSATLIWPSTRRWRFAVHASMASP